MFFPYTVCGSGSSCNLRPCRLGVDWCGRLLELWHGLGSLWLPSCGGVMDCQFGSVICRRSCGCDSLLCMGNCAHAMRSFIIAFTCFKWHTYIKTVRASTAYQFEVGAGVLEADAYFCAWRLAFPIGGLTFYILAAIWDKVRHTVLPTTFNYFGKLRNKLAAIMRFWWHFWKNNVKLVGIQCKSRTLTTQAQTQAFWLIKPARFPLEIWIKQRDKLFKFFRKSKWFASPREEDVWPSRTMRCAHQLGQWMPCDTAVAAVAPATSETFGYNGRFNGLCWSWAPNSVHKGFLKPKCTYISRKVLGRMVGPLADVNWNGQH